MQHMSKVHEINARLSERDVAMGYKPPAVQGRPQRFDPRHIGGPRGQMPHEEDKEITHNENDDGVHQHMFFLKVC